MEYQGFDPTTMDENAVRAFYEMCADGFRSYADGDNNLIDFFYELRNELGKNMADDAVWWLFGSEGCDSIIENYEDEDGWFEWDDDHGKFNSWIIDDLCLYMNNNYTGEEYTKEFLDALLPGYAFGNQCVAIDAMIEKLTGYRFIAALEVAASK